jgi:hypothetical protein
MIIFQNQSSKSFAPSGGAGAMRLGEIIDLPDLCLKNWLFLFHGKVTMPYSFIISPPSSTIVSGNLFFV